MRSTFLIVFIGFFLCLYSVAFAQETGASDSTETVEQLNYDLLVFASRGESDFIKLWLEKGADVNALSKDGVSALMYASQNGHLNAVKTLVANGADVNYHPVGKISALAAAVIKDKIEIADYLLFRNADVNALDSRNISPLMFACANGNMEMVKLLLFYKAKMNAHDIYGNTPLMIAVESNLLQLSAYLVDRGADINAADNHGTTSLHVAAQNGWIGMASFLVEHNANSALRDNFSDFPLDLAVLNNQLTFIRSYTQKNGILAGDRRRPAKLACISHNVPMLDTLKSNRYPHLILPFFDKFFIGLGTMVNVRNSFLGMSLGFTEIKYNFCIYSSVSLRVNSSSENSLLSQDVLGQNKEIRNMVRFVLEKRIPWFSKKYRETGFSVGIGQCYNGGFYTDRSIHFPDHWTSNPGIGFYSEGRRAGIKADIEYNPFEEKKEVPFYINMQFNIFFSTTHFNGKKKIAEW